MNKKKKKGETQNFAKDVITKMIILIITQIIIIEPDEMVAVAVMNF